MRFIDRDRMTPPPLLLNKRTDQAREDVKNFIEQTYSKGGTRRTPRSDWLDSDSEFQSNLAVLFNYCCAYCETETAVPRNGHEGLVSRHRPPMLAEDESGNTDLLAYSWLTYEWDNLLWLCPTCARNKGNRFFIKGKRGQPFLSITELRDQEVELILDPCFHSPGQHIDFNLNGLAKPQSDIGKVTIDVLDLNRPFLIKSRRSAIRDFLIHLSQGGIVSYGRPVVDVGGETFGPHAGAIRLAVMVSAEAMGLFSGSVSSFSDFLNSSTPEIRQSLADNILRNTSDLEFETGPPDQVLQSSSVKREIAKPPSRIPNVRKLPNAQRPITRVEISNFKALREIAFDLPERVADSEQSPCMLLLGENATGKSSVLEAMALAVIGSDEAAALHGAIDTEGLSPADLIHRPDPYRWTETAPSMGVRLSFLDSSIPAKLNALAGDARFSGDTYCSKVVLAYGPRRFFTKRQTRRYRAPAHRVRSLFDPMAMIANPMLWLSTLEGKHWEAAARALREVLMLAENDDFERDEDPDMPGSIYIRQGEQRVAMKDLSVGYKSVIAMVCDIIRELLYHYDNLEFASAVVFIDEIETHLHPRWKMQIMTLLRRAFPKIQFIATTHDPLCLRGMYDGEVFVLQRSAEDQIERVLDLPSIRGMRADQILTSEFFGLGSTDPETDARLLRYNRLAARIETLSDEEQAELRRLRTALDDGMVLGSTLREQAYAEALKAEVDRQDVAPTKTASPRRADLRATFSALFEKRT
jgi:hypothetical protein